MANDHVTRDENDPQELKRAGWRLEAEVFELVESFAQRQQISKEQAASQLIKDGFHFADKGGHQVGESISPTAYSINAQALAPIPSVFSPPHGQEFERISTIFQSILDSLETGRFESIGQFISQLDEYAKKHREIVDKNLNELSRSQLVLEKAISDFSALPEHAKALSSGIDAMADDSREKFNEIVVRFEQDKAMRSDEISQYTALIKTTIGEVKDSAIYNIRKPLDQIGDDLYRIGDKLDQTRAMCDFFYDNTRQISKASSDYKNELLTFSDSFKKSISFFQNKALALVTIICSVLVLLGVTTSLYFAPAFNQSKTEEFARTQIKKIMEDQINALGQKFDDHFKKVAEGQDDKLKRYFETEASRFEAFKRQSLSDVARARAEAHEAQSDALKWKNAAYDYADQAKRAKMAIFSFCPLENDTLHNVLMVLAMALIFGGGIFVGRRLFLQ